MREAIGRVDGENISSAWWATTESKSQSEK